MAHFLGEDISHQKVGRWLRAGDPARGYDPEPGGSKTIPSYAEKPINNLWQAYLDTAPERVESQGITFDKQIPVYFQRLRKRDGEFGDRVVVAHTEFLTKELRDETLRSAHRTNKYHAVSVRSTINLHDYNNRSDKSQQGITRNAEQKQYRREFRALIKQGVIRKAMQTPMEDIRGNLTDIEQVIENVNKRLRERHEPATSDKGTHLADEILFQLRPKPVYVDEHGNRERKAAPSAAKLSQRRARTKLKRD